MIRVRTFALSDRSYEQFKSLGSVNKAKIEEGRGIMLRRNRKIYISTERLDGKNTCCAKNLRA